MPSVELVRLRRQAVELAEFFPQPESFARRLDLLLESYSAAPSRRGDIQGMRTLLAAYGAPPLVLKQIYLECLPLAADEPELALDVADQLWTRRVREPRLLAIRLLGSTPAPSTEALTSRLQRWNAENREAELMLELGQEGTRHLRSRQPEALLAWVQILFKDESWRQAALGLIAVEALVRQDDFLDLPAVFTLLGQFSVERERRLRPFWLDGYQALVDRSPQETLYHLLQRLNENHEGGISWLARQMLDQFSDEEQAQLRAAL